MEIVTENNFDGILASSKVVLVDFWASWCGPCRMLSPIISQIADEKAGKIKVGKVNVDEEPALATQFGISAIPMVAKFEGGRLTASVVGYMPKADLEKQLGI